MRNLPANMCFEMSRRRDSPPHITVNFRSKPPPHKLLQIEIIIVKICNLFSVALYLFDPNRELCAINIIRLGGASKKYAQEQ